MPYCNRTMIKQKQTKKNN